MDLEALTSYQFEPKVVRYTDRDVMLYALSLGICQDPLDENELAFVYEKSLKTLPSISAVLAHPGPWVAIPEFKINFVKLLHGEQRAEFFKPLPVEAEIRGEYSIRAVLDKGAEKGALVYFDKLLFDNSSNERLAKVTQVLFLRGDGGCGSFGEVPDNLAAVPERAPDFVEEVATSKGAALLYRLNGDRNLIHVDPEVAKKAGFSVPIAHGLWAYGICGFSVIKNALAYDPLKMASLDLRFSSPVLPGETLVVEGWNTEGGTAFQATVKERNKLAISNGFVANA